MADNPFNAAPPPPPHGNLRPIIPVLARRGEFMPRVDGPMSVDLGAEIVATKVLQVLSEDVVVVEVTGIVVDKSGHGYKKGSVVPIQRTWNGLQEIWVPISERATREREHLEAVKRQVAADNEAKRQAANRAAQQQPEPQAEEAAEVAVAEAEVVNQPRKVLGPRRSKITRST